jgi:ATP-dependent DNA helicase DinG
MNDYLDNVVFLNISDEIKIENKDIKNIDEIKNDKKIITNNKNLAKKILKGNFEILDITELAMILEPYHKDYSIDYLSKVLIKNPTDNSLLEILKALFLRHKKREEGTLEPLTFKINSFFTENNFDKWNWSEFLDSNNSYDIEIIEENEKIKRKPNKEVFDKIYSHSKDYEELLKDKKIWQSKEGFVYEYREGQFELTKTIKETFRGNSKVSCIEAPTGIGKSVGYLLSAVLESKLYSKRIIISTDTKELQTQLINKDIPNVINSLGLDVSYGYIKGKNNYICRDRLDSLEYKNENLTKDDLICIFFIQRLIEDGKFGDIEEISPMVIEKYDKLKIYLNKVSCDANICRPKKCSKVCLYKNRVEELKEEDITVINHSLLAKWPYKDEKPIENIIVDEAHNLVEKGYDFFSSSIEYKSLNFILQEIYPYENMQNSKFLHVKKSRKIKMFDKFYNHIRIDREQKEKISHHINLIVEEIESILDFGKNSDYLNASKFNLRWELNIQKDELAKEGLKFNLYTEKIKLSCERIISNLSSVLFIIDRNMDDDSIDKEADIFKFGKSKYKDLEDIKTIFELFLEYDENEDVARIVELDKNFTNFEFKITPLKLSDLFEENILSQLESGIFLSATLTVGGNMKYFKNTLGINRVKNLEKIIKPLYMYDERVLVLKIEDMCDYKNKNFAKEISEVISDISKFCEGHTLSLFNSTQRLNNTYEILNDYFQGNNIEVYKDKKAIKYLKDLNKRCVVLGSKGCFEGVDIPGDGLICVTLDKIPNINPKDPLYFTIMRKYNTPYQSLNYPQMVIKVKQAMGRLLRSKFDYGCFIIFDAGENIKTLSKLQRDIHGCRIMGVNKHNINKNIENHFKINRAKILNNALVEIFNTKKINEDTKLLNDKIFINSELRRRNINSQIYDIDEKHKTIKIKYFNQSYRIEKLKFIKNNVKY